MLPVNSSFTDTPVQSSHWIYPHVRSPPLDSLSKAVPVYLSIYLSCLSTCVYVSVCVFCLRVCAYVWASASSVFPPSVAWASVALHEMNALFPPRFQMWCSVWMTAASRPTSLCSSPAATGWPPCSAALSWRATLRR